MQEGAFGHVHAWITTTLPRNSDGLTSVGNTVLLPLLLFFFFFFV